MATINKEQWQEMASDYIEGLLSPDDAARVGAFLAQDAEARREYAQLRAMWAQLDALPPVEPPLYFRDNLMYRIESEKKHAFDWRGLLPRIGRTAGGTLAAAGAGFALAWMMLYPSSNENRIAPRAGLSPLVSLLPGRKNAVPAQPKPRPVLNVGRVVTLPSADDPAYDFSLWLENGADAAVRVQLLDNVQEYRIRLAGTSPQTVRVPFSVADGKGALGMKLTWTVDGVTRTKTLLVPTPANITDNKPAPAPAVQSFGLPEAPLVDEARMVAARYNVPVTLEEIKTDAPMRVNAANETALQTLRRHMTPMGLQVSEGREGILIASPAAP